MQGIFLFLPVQGDLSEVYKDAEYLCRCRCPFLHALFCCLRSVYAGDEAVHWNLGCLQVFLHGAEVTWIGVA